MKHFDGKMKAGVHTTLTDLAQRIVGAIHRLPEIAKVSPGHIQCGKGVAGGTQRVKIGSYDGGVLLTVRQSRSVQELRVFMANGTTCHAAKLAIARAIRGERIPIAFGKKAES